MKTNYLDNCSNKELKQYILRLEKKIKIMQDNQGIRIRNALTKHRNKAIVKRNKSLVKENEFLKSQLDAIRNL